MSTSVRNQPSAEPTHPEELTADELFDMLSNQRRRFAMWYLLDVRETTVRDLSRVVAAWENDIAPEAVTATQRKRVYTGLHQTHLIRMETCGLLEYDRDRGTVVAHDRLSVFEPFLLSDREGPTRSPRLMGSLGVAYLAIGGVALLGGSTLGSLGAATLSLLLAVTLLGWAGVRLSGAARRSLPESLHGLQPPGERTMGEPSAE